jgi:hypothetical protein
VWANCGIVADVPRMDEIQHPSEPKPLNRAARLLRVPARWLREEIDAGRIPALIAGRSVLVHVPTAAALLAERAKGDSGVNHE